MAHDAPDATFHWSDLRRPVRRWTAVRKATLVDAVHTGRLDRTEMLTLHGISPEEFDSWMIKRFEDGTAALRSTKLQQYPAVRA